MHWKTQLGLVLTLIISQKHAYRNIHYRAAGSWDKAADGRITESCHSPATQFHIWFIQGRWPNVLRATQCPWEGSTCWGCCLFCTMSWGLTRHDRGDTDSLHRRLLPVRHCAGLQLLHGCVFNLNHGFLETAYRVPGGRWWGRCCLNAYLMKHLKCGVLPPSGHRVAIDIMSYTIFPTELSGIGH